MDQRVVECVPNFSEGRDRAKIKQITDAIEAVRGARLLDVDPGADTNRTVVTFVGDPDAVAEAAFQAIARAAQVIDMGRHLGLPRDLVQRVSVQELEHDRLLPLHAATLGELRRGGHCW
jgi:glutamate formiminotransferase